MAGGGGRRRPAGACCSCTSRSAAIRRTGGPCRRRPGGVRAGASPGATCESVACGHRHCAREVDRHAVGALAHPRRRGADSRRRRPSTGVRRVPAVAPDGRARTTRSCAREPSRERLGLDHRRPGRPVGHYQRIGRGWRSGTTVRDRAGRSDAGCRRPRRRSRHPRDRRACGPENLVPAVHAVCLTRRQRLRPRRRRRCGLVAGGSPSSGSPSGLEDQPDWVVPIVPAAVDLRPRARRPVHQSSDRRVRPAGGRSGPPVDTSPRGRPAPGRAPSPAGCKAASARRPSTSPASSSARSRSSTSSGRVVDPGSGLPWCL